MNAVVAWRRAGASCGLRLWSSEPHSLHSIPQTKTMRVVDASVAMWMMRSPQIASVAGLVAVV
jgi:hypothetical protein